jgi:hypothetical protein
MGTSTALRNINTLSTVVSTDERDLEVLACTSVLHKWARAGQPTR